MDNYLKAPFPYFGGKSRIDARVWQALGDVKHYIEPFFGSGAVLLARPDYNPNVHLANVWRALQFAPDEVARWCDWPVNHVDLIARKRALVKNEPYLLENLVAAPEWHDAKLAGYWIWAASSWIGAGLTRPNARTHLSRSGQGIHALGKRPDLSKGGEGVHKIGLRPIANTDMDVREPYNTNIYAWFRALSERLRYVRVVCGDWTRVCNGNWQDLDGIVGVFFDPPYSVKDRDPNVYDHDSLEVAHAVRQWCIERGNRPTYRIVLAGYDEHEELATHGWRKEIWRAQGGYSNLAKGESQGKKNKHRESLWFSPHCLNRQHGLLHAYGDY